MQKTSKKLKKSQITTDGTHSLLGLETQRVWDTELAYAHLKNCGEADTKRTAERKLHALGLLPQELSDDDLRDEYGRPPKKLVLDWAMQQARKRRERVLFTQLSYLPNKTPCLHANDARGARIWVPLRDTQHETISQGLSALQHHISRPIAVFPHGALVTALRETPSTSVIRLCPQAYRPPLTADHPQLQESKPTVKLSPHLRRLEAESIHIIREAVAESQNPAMLYSIGKDSSVMLHLARKAFYPGVPPFPLLHVDTGWKFKDMITFRDNMAKQHGFDLIVHQNKEGVEAGINPFDHGSSKYTDIMKTQGLKQALDKYGFDAAFGGARRDEEKSRAKERVYSFRDAKHRWDPKNQRPELWNLYNGKVNKGESIRVFPLSNWTELDIWQYIYLESIPLVPL